MRVVSGDIKSCPSSSEVTHNIHAYSERKDDQSLVETFVISKTLIAHHSAIGRYKGEENDFLIRSRAPTLLIVLKNRSVVYVLVY